MIEFEYTYENYNKNQLTLKYPIEIPFKENINELAHEIVTEKMDPLMKILDADIDITKKLKEFIDKQNQEYYNNRDEDLINKARNGQVHIDATIHELNKKYKDGILSSAEQMRPTDEEIFAQYYNRLLHSASLPDILNKEKIYAKEIAEMTNKMHNEIETLTQHQEIEMKNKLEQLDVSTTNDDINDLLTIQYSDQQALRKKWESELKAKKGHQKYSYREWIMTKASDTLCSTTYPPSIGNRSSMFVLQTPSMEESFTIHLGSQLKHMHNIRILSGDINDVCNILHTDDSLSDLNTPLGLYSCSLSGVVVLTPSGSNVHLNENILRNTAMSTEFHFDETNVQIEKSLNELQKSDVEEKNNGYVNGNGGGGGGLSGNTSKHSKKLKPGDIFITKHSNLSQAHVIFHLVSDEAFNSPQEISSRHPVILGLRNILKIASRHDITMLTIPALLRHEMSGEMTVPWCVRRAELIFKCAKGFMIESGTWGGAELSTLQLLLPRDVSEDLFTTLVSMVPHVFRVANPKILVDTSNNK